jgi:hypothetical protein
MRMPISEETSRCPKSVLIITSSGGGGLLQAANAKEQEIRAKYPDAVVIQRDVMKDWMWKGLGRFFVWQWNRAQLRGDVRAQVFFGAAAPFIEYFFWPHIFFCSLFTIFKRDVDQVIDTQVMGTSAIIKALRVFNRKKKKQVKLEKVLVDMPTSKATHFFSAIKKLSSKDRSFFKLITIAPLLEKGQTEADFWKVHCNLTNRELQYEDFYVRQAFRSYRNRGKTRAATVLKTLYKNEEELGLIQQALGPSLAAAKVQKGHLEFAIGDQDRVITILLGSQPAIDSTLNYVKKFIALAKESQLPRIPTYLFVFCADHKPGSLSLFKMVSDYAARVKGYPSYFSVVPMSFQSDQVIAPLFHRSDITCTRSGGQTAMELLCVGSGQIWIHSEAKNKTGHYTNEELLAGIPGWESANAVYMQQMGGAKIVTPDSFAPYARPIMEGKPNS